MNNTATMSDKEESRSSVSNHEVEGSAYKDDDASAPNDADHNLKPS
jgi:hypothetical protein